MSVDGYRAQQYIAPPPPPVSPGAPPPYEGVVVNTNIPLGAAIFATLTAGLGFLSYWLKPIPKDNIVFVDKHIPMYVNQTVEVEKVIYVDKPYVVEKTIYIDKPIIVEKTIEKIVKVPIETTIYVDKIIEPECPLVSPMECPDPYGGL